MQFQNYICVFRESEDGTRFPGKFIYLFVTRNTLNVSFGLWIAKSIMIIGHLFTTKFAYAFRFYFAVEVAVLTKVFVV